AAIRSRAVRNGDSYVLSGEKAPVSMGCSADVAMFFAKTDPAAGARGVSCFWMPLDLPGITSSPISHTGWKPMSAASVNLVDVVLAKSLLVGEEGKGFSITMGMADCARPLVGLLALGLAQSSLDEAATYVQQRSAFGRPLSKFEGISFSIAERATSIEAARLLCYNTLAMEDEGLRHTKESAMCKLLCPEVAISTIHASIRMHGHVGYSEYYPLEQRLRDAVGFEFTDGTPEIMKLVIARELMGRMAVPY
ncbi:MAG: acyl-CoA dehydrogenase family protein, partial [Gammaproteobacteria bacterium]|nr:acyl-CoA dehydrogenase family protein [Gammaproteobacteria bacterium]